MVKIHKSSNLGWYVSSEEKENPQMRGFLFWIFNLTVPSGLKYPSAQKNHREGEGEKHQDIEKSVVQTLLP